MPKIVFVESDGAEHIVHADIGESLMDAAINNGVPGILAECGGACACATCHVIPQSDWLDKLVPRDKMEAGMLEGAVDPTSSSRLACQIEICEIHDGLRVNLPERQI